MGRRGGHGGYADVDWFECPNGRCASRRERAYFLARDGRMSLRRWLPVRALLGIDGEVDTADIAGCFFVGLQGLAAYEIQAIIFDCFLIH